MSPATLTRHAVLLSLLCTVLAPGVSRAEPVRLTLLSLTDLHGAIAKGIEDRSSGRTLGSGSALFTTVAAERRPAPEATLLFDVGDSMQGTAISNLTQGRATIDFLNLLGVDAGAVGNHGFDWGVEVLVERMGQASFPILAANVVEKQSGHAPPWARPYHLLERRGIRIAVVGLITQNTPQVTIPENVAAYHFTDPAAAAVRLVAELVPKKADLVVLLCHFGFSPHPVLGAELKDTAAALEGFQDRVVIFAGHTHQQLAEKVGGVVTAQPRSSGRQLARITLLFDPDAGGIVESEASLLDVIADGVAADPRVAEVLRPFQEEVGEIMEEALGHAGVYLELDLRAESRIGNLLTDAIREQHGADIVFQNSQGVRAPIAEGPVRYEDVFNALPFENTVVLMSLKGSEVAEVLAQADANNRLLYTSGLRFALHLSRPEGERIEILSDLEPDRVYRVAVNSFLAQGGDGLSRLVEIGGGRDTGVVLRDVLAEKFRRENRAGRAVEAALDGRIVIVEAKEVSIMEIQGRETFSPLAGQRVATTGVVTQTATDGDGFSLQGFWLQDADGDGDATTSDGVYVSLEEAGTALVSPRPGDRIRILAEVEEEQTKRALPHTRLVKPTAIEVLQSGQTLPAAVPLVDLPDVDLADAVAFWEPLEGMRVRVGAATVVGPTEINGMFVLLAADDAVAGSGYFPETHHLLARSLGGDRVDYNPERIIVQSRETPPLRPGDEVLELTGAVVYASGVYMVRPDTLRVVSQELPPVPLSRRDGEAGDFKVTCYNLRDLFDTIDTPVMRDERFTPSPEDLDLQLTKLALSIVVELELPEILVANEYESPAILQALGDRVNAAAGTRYRSASLETSDWRGLEVGFLYDEDRVDLVDYYQLSGDDVVEAFGEGIFRTREPLVGVFRFSDSGAPLYIFANKFKTKRGEDPRMSLNEQPVRKTEAQRKLQAKVVRHRVDAMLAEDPDALILVTGDLGDFQFPEPGETGEDPIGTLEGRGDEPRLTNLIDLETEAERFTYIFQGNSMAFTHMLVSPALLKLLAGTDVLHFNAGLPDVLQHDPTTPLRASDRDPVEGRFYFPQRAGEMER